MRKQRFFCRLMLFLLLLLPLGAQAQSLQALTKQIVSEQLALRDEQEKLMEENTERCVHTKGDTVVARLPETGALRLCEKDGISLYWKSVSDGTGDISRTV